MSDCLGQLPLRPEHLSGTIRNVDGILETGEAVLANPDESLRETRAAVTNLEVERAAFEAHRTQLQMELAALEALLGKRTRRLLGAER